MTKCGDTKGLIIYGCGLVWKEDRWGWIMDHNLFRDHLSIMTPNGRPRRKPKRLVERCTQIESNDPLQYYITEKPKPSKLGLKQCISSRPHLPPGPLWTPSPCQYNIPTSSLSNRGGIKYYYNPLKQNIRHTNNEDKTPSPSMYKIQQTIGNPCPYLRTSPSYTMGRRTKETSFQYEYQRVAPNTYNTGKAKDVTLHNGPVYTINHSRTPSRQSSTPGPAHYSPTHSLCQTRSPTYCIGLHKT